jgi:hypothetical protein
MPASRSQDVEAWLRHGGTSGRLRRREVVTKGGFSKLLQLRNRQSCLSSARQLHRDSVAAVVEQPNKVRPRGAGHSYSRTAIGTSVSYTRACEGAARHGRRSKVLCEGRMLEICVSGSVTGRWKRGRIKGIRARPDERAGNR